MATMEAHAANAAAAPAGRAASSDHDVEQGISCEAAVRMEGEPQSVYGATGGEPQHTRRRHSNRRAVAAGLLLGVAAIAAVTMLGGDTAPVRPAGLTMQRLDSDGADAPEVLSRSLPPMVHWRMRQKFSFSWVHFLGSNRVGKQSVCRDFTES